MLQRKTGLRPQKFIIDSSKATLLLWLILIVNVRPLSVCLWLTVQNILDKLVAICWERAAPLGFRVYCFYFSAVLIVGVSFPFCV